MRKHLIALLGFLSGVAVYYVKAPPTQELAREEFHQQEFVSTTQAAPVQATRAPAVPVNVAATDFSREELETQPGLPRGMKFAPKIKAIPEESFSGTEFLLKKNGFVYVRDGGAGTSGANVVYDQRLDTFHPITETIKVSGVDERTRSDLLREWDEFHYNADLGILFVQSTADRLFEDFERLRKSGRDASLEVIQSVYRTR